MRFNLTACRPGLTIRALRIFALTCLFGLGCTLALAADSGTSAPSKAAENLKFGLLLDSGGLGDGGFMDMQYEGLRTACSKTGAGFEVVQMPLNQSGPEVVLAKLGELAAKGCKAVFCTSPYMRAGLDKAARKYPEVRFVLMDEKAVEYLPNVASVSFRTGQAAYLAGYLAANLSHTGVLGVIGGRNIPQVNEFIFGFKAGAKKAKPETQVKVRYISEQEPSADPWLSPRVAASLARKLIGRKGADVLFPVAGTSGIGVFEVVLDKGLFGIGVDTDQDGLAKGHILTSVMKRLDVAVERIAVSIAEGRFANRDHVFELANAGVDISPMRFTRQIIPAKLQDEITSLGSEIISGKIKVPSALE